jgi:putative FmdB family regulatory protein
MPVYDYVCGSCNHRFEAFHGLNEAGPHQCPLCEGPVRRAFAPPAIHFKGSGWAKLDRRSPGSPGRRTADAGSKPSAAPTSTAPTGSAPAGASSAGPAVADPPPAPKKD